MATTRIWGRGQLTIPAELRKELHLEKETMLNVVKIGDSLLLTPRRLVGDRIAQAAQKEMKKVGVSLDDLLKERRRRHHTRTSGTTTASTTPCVVSQGGPNQMIKVGQIKLTNTAPPTPSSRSSRQSYRPNRRNRRNRPNRPDHQTNQSNHTDRRPIAVGQVGVAGGPEPAETTEGGKRQRSLLYCA